MSLNVNQYDTRHGPWARRRSLLLDVIRQAEPDVVMLQAVRCTPHVAEGRDQARQIADALTPPRATSGYAYSHFEAVSRSWDGTRIGVGMVARRPVIEERAAPLTRRGGTEDTLDRVVMGARVGGDEGALAVINAYASWVPSEGAGNVREILAFAETWGTPCLIAGDFNADPTAPVLTPLKDAGFVDVWTALKPEDAGATFVEGRHLRRIDYIWASPDLVPALVDIALVADRTHPDGTRPSDHAGLLVTIDLSRRRRMAA